MLALCASNLGLQRYDTVPVPSGCSVFINSRTDPAMLWVSIAAVCVSAVTLLVVILQRRESIRAYRIALLAMMLEQDYRISVEPSDLSEQQRRNRGAYLRAVLAVMRKWARHEADVLDRAVRQERRRK